MDGMMMAMNQENDVLKSSTGVNELAIPAILQPDIDGIYHITAQQGEIPFFAQQPTQTYGYNGNFLGPVLRFTNGEKITVKITNALAEETTLHWHGLEVAEMADGGPHQVIAPQESKTVSYTVSQQAATLWFHPHPLNKTAEQVFKGLAGLVYIDDDQHNNLPNTYGVDDIPLILQDRNFTDDFQLDYSKLKNDDGTKGQYSLINGTLNPVLHVRPQLTRLRILNGSNARNYTLHLSNRATFYQIATDGGFLNEPVAMQSLKLSPAERAEILIDFSQFNEPVALVNDMMSEILPFTIAGEVTNNKTLPTEPLNNFAITDEERQLPVNKKIELYGMADFVEINGKKFDPERIDETQKIHVTEVWEIYNKPDMMGGMVHPFHIHGTQFKILSRNGETPPANEYGWKDTFAIASDERVKIAVTFEHKGIYMYHCHNLEHEDFGMMAQVKVD